MTIGVGGTTTQQALETLENMASDIAPIETSEFRSRIEKLQQAMQVNSVDAVYLHAGTGLYYFTGLQWHPSERMVGAIVPSQGDPIYIAPKFELDTLRDYWLLTGEIRAWEEHECPYQLFGQIVASSANQILLDETTPYFVVDGLIKSNPGLKFGLAQPLTQSIRARKSAAEIAIIQRAHEMTLAVIKATAATLSEGVSTTEVIQFIDQAHRAVGAAGSSFCIVLFGVATSFPHGVKEPQILKRDDWVLIDTGCLLHQYHSDITRSFCFGTPTDEQTRVWQIEKQAQLAAFDAAQLGQPCEAADYAARTCLESNGFGPDYQLPGLPHRTGHGCGLDIHEGPYLVRGEKTPLQVGMVFSSEPMLVIPGHFGVRLEDHFHMTASGPVWFTQPAHSIEAPFG